MKKVRFDIVARNSLRHHKKKKRMKWTIFKEFLFPAHFQVFLLHEKVTDDEGVPSLVSNLSVQVFYHMKKLLMTGKSSVFYHREKGRVRVTGTDDEGWVRGSP